MTLSFKKQLKKIGEPRNGKKIPPFPSGFNSTPTSLRAAMRAMESPFPKKWKKTTEQEFANEDWTRQCNGVTTDGEHWYFSSNADGDKRVYRFSRNFQSLGNIDLNPTGSNHLGDIEYHNGVIYCAMEQPVQVIMVPTASFKSYQSARLFFGDKKKSPSQTDLPWPPQTDFPWCAIHPWNGLLYSSRYGGDSEGTRTINAFHYERHGRFSHVPKATIHLQETGYKIQGGCFTKNGHLLLASESTNDIRCYSVLNGAYLGRTWIQKSGGVSLNYEEIEGLTVWENFSYKGVTTHVHVVLLDQDWPSGDDIYFKSYHVPDWKNL